MAHQQNNQQQPQYYDPARTGYGSVNVNEAVPPPAVYPHGLVPDAPSPAQQRGMWRCRALMSIILGTLFIFVGARNIALRNEGNHGACCLPRGCDVAKLNEPGWTPLKSRDANMCNFTVAEIKQMGCADAFQRTEKCELHFRYPDYSPCDDDQAKHFLVGSGIPLIVVGGLAILTAILFFLPGYDCYGGVEFETTGCNKCAYVVTIMMVFLCLSGAIVGIVFGSLLTSKLFAHQFDTHATCHTHHDETVCKHNHGAQWAGDSCPSDVVGTPADVFSWVQPTHQQKAHAVAALSMSVFFVLACIVAASRAVVRCCRRCTSKSHEQRYRRMQTSQMEAQPVVGVVDADEVPPQQQQPTKSVV